MRYTAISSTLFFCILFLFQCFPANLANQSAGHPEKVVLRDNANLKNKETPVNLKKLQRAYPAFIKEVESNAIVWKDGTKMIFDDGITRTGEDLLNNADLKEQMQQVYTKGKVFEIPTVDFEPGRVRNDAFFKKMYGQNEAEARAKLVAIKWLPSSLNQTLYMSSVNGVAEKLQSVSNELDKLPHLKPYLIEIGGTFNWRVIKATTRLSPHSFGIAIDINVANSDYWLNNPLVNGKIIYKNRIPLEIVEIFEKYGFIWGGKWYHYDTMHFEYRPELMIEE